MSDTPETWHAIQNDAKARAAVQMPPEPGAFLAWSICGHKGVTVGITELHRVGEPIRGDAYTTCRHPIPDPVLWLSLSPALVRTMPRCGFCEAGVARAAREDAA